MPKSSSRLVDKILARIEESEYELTVHYPAVRPVPSGVAPIQAPVSPMIPFKAPPVISQPVEEADPVRPPVTMKCLYVDGAGLYQLRQQRVQVSEQVWGREIKALARVNAADVELDGNQTVFEGASHVMIGTERFVVLGLSKVAASWSRKGTYYVYLTGAAKAI